MERQDMCLCGVIPEISNFWTSRNAGRHWERCVSRQYAYFILLDEQLKSHALAAVEDLCTEMSMKRYDMKQDMWAEYRERLAKL